jgi:hypothetical protein
MTDGLRGSVDGRHQDRSAVDRLQLYHLNNRRRLSFHVSRANDDVARGNQQKNCRDSQYVPEHSQNFLECHLLAPQPNCDHLKIVSARRDNSRPRVGDIDNFAGLLARDVPRVFARRAMFA